MNIRFLIIAALMVCMTDFVACNKEAAPAADAPAADAAKAGDAAKADAAKADQPRAQECVHIDGSPFALFCSS